MKQKREKHKSEKGENETDSCGVAVLGCSLGMAKLLVLLDMNGTLLYRAKSRLPKLTPDLAPSGARKSPLPGVKYFYYVRPQAQWFVQALMAMPRVRLAFCTSMQGANARPAVDYLAGEGWNQRGVLLLDRRFQKPDDQGKNEWDTMRDMAKVWAHLAVEHGAAGSLRSLLRRGRRHRGVARDVIRISLDCRRLLRRSRCIASVTTPRERPSGRGQRGEGEEGAKRFVRGDSGHEWSSVFSHRIRGESRE